MTIDDGDDGTDDIDSDERGESPIKFLTIQICSFGSVCLYRDTHASHCGNPLLLHYYYYFWFQLTATAAALVFTMLFHSLESIQKYTQYPAEAHIHAFVPDRQEQSTAKEK